MDKDVARLITLLREEIEAFDPGSDLARIGLKQSHAEALYAIWMAWRHGYLGLARARTTMDEKRERALCDDVLRAIADEVDAPTGDWAGDVFYGSALLRVATTINGTLKYRFLPLYGAGFCRSRARLEEQACQDGLISAADRRLLGAIGDDASVFKHDHDRTEFRAVTSLYDLAVGLRVVVGVARGLAELPQAGEARA